MSLNTMGIPSPHTDHHKEFKAPPPSPINSSRRTSSVTNEEVLTEFLEHSLRVPDLILPDSIFPRQKPLQNNIVPTIDLQSLINTAPPAGNIDVPAASNILVEALASIGCFQLVNHGVSTELMRSVMDGAMNGIFRVSRDKKVGLLRRTEMPYGFDEVCGGDEDGEIMTEEFVWCDHHLGFKLKMERMLASVGCESFSDAMQSLSSSIEKVAAQILAFLLQQTSHSAHKKPAVNTTPIQQSNKNESVCYIHKHPKNTCVDGCISSLRYDVIRMMIKGPEYPHSISLHLCYGCSEFHAYSKKGWVSFKPEDQNALIVTVGDQIQAWSDGQYKPIIGRPIYTSKTEDFISMAFLYSPPSIITKNYLQGNNREEKVITLVDQALFALIFTLLCQFLLYIYSKF